MKLPILITFLLATLLAALPFNSAHAEDATFKLFYNGLSNDGDWYSTPEYGYVFQPSAANKTDRWCPYSNGYWAQTDDGWTWVSHENFGWATYHYGRWTRLEEIGWVWVPGYDWGPAWVSWRTSNDYVGWAPLPPKNERNSGPGYKNKPANSSTRIASVDYYDVESEEGYTSAVDRQYDIGPDRYCFVRVRDFGNMHLNEVLVPSAQKMAIIQTTVNATETSYRRGPERLMVINHGPGLKFINEHVAQPIQHLRLEHHDDLAFLQDHARDGVNPTFVRDGTLHVASPTIVGRPVDFLRTRPPSIKQEFAQVVIDHGWNHTGAAEQTIQEVRDHFKKQAALPDLHPVDGGSSHE